MNFYRLKFTGARLGSGKVLPFVGHGWISSAQFGDFFGIIYQIGSTSIFFVFLFPHHDDVYG